MKHEQVVRQSLRVSNSGRAGSYARTCEKRCGRRRLLPVRAIIVSQSAQPLKRAGQCLQMRSRAMSIGD